MKETPISGELLESHGFIGDDEEGIDFTFRPKKEIIIQYHFPNHVVYMSFTKNGYTQYLHLFCHTWEQLRYYANIIGINQELELQRPERLALVINKCVYCRAVDRDIWVSLHDLDDQHEIVFHTKEEWDKIMGQSMNPLIRCVFAHTGVFMDYENLMKNT